MHYRKLQEAPSTLLLGCPDCAAACLSAERRHLLSPVELLRRGPREAKPARQQRCRQLLGTRVRISAEGSEGADGADKRLAQAAIAEAFAAVERVEKKLSARREGSDLARIAREAHLQPVAVDDWTFEVLEKSCALARESQGALDPALGGRLAALGLLPPLPGAPEPDPGATFEDLYFSGRRVGARRPLRLDLSGLAKGFALDRAVDALRAAGIESGMVEAGGDLRVFGEAAVTVGVRHPAEPQKIAVALELQGGAIATTGTYDRHHRSGGRSCARTACYLIRPWDGEPLATLETVSVLAESAFEADALTRMLLFRRLRAEEHFLRRGAAGLRIDRRGRVAWVGAATQKAA